MPLTRYQIRDEFGLADPELYKAADKDDPEALLEGIAMAGLVGVLRQLGDLAEFAAEIFHDLHEEVMATAARGHGLMARVQQLEAEVPSIEKTFISQTNHSEFFSNAGVDWHPNLHMEQNMVTRGDLPRFVMDSYEECRGPPRLFLLDKFDVAGAGACLKRYTDPSVFKVETASSGITTAEVQRDKKVRRVKKKGSRWKNGETPEIVQTSHAKLHQLFLEERVENGHSDPARLVKLKRRPLNRFLFDLKPGKSYMEKFLESFSAECEIVSEASVTPPALKFTSDSSSESGLEVREISMVSPMGQSIRGKERCASPNVHEVVQKPFVDELNMEVTDREIVNITDTSAYDKTDESPLTIHKMAIEEELSADEDIKTEGSLDDHSDDMTSEVENYLDALTTMDSEMETDTENKPKHNKIYLNVGKHGVEHDASELQQDVHGNLSDSQSIGNSSLSADGNDSFKKGRSSFSYSDSLSNLAENTPSDGEGAAKAFPSAKSSVADILDLPSDHLSECVETQGTESHELVTRSTKEEMILNPREASCSSSLADSNLILPSAPVANSLVVSLAVPELDETPSDLIKLGSRSPNKDRNDTDMVDASEVLFDVHFQTKQDKICEISHECHFEDELDHEDKNVFSDSSVYLLSVSELASDKKDGDDLVTEVLQTDSVDACAENLVERIDFPHALTSPTEEQFPHSALADVGVDSTVISLLDSSDVVKPDNLVSEVDETIAGKGDNLENLAPMVDDSEANNIVKHQCSDVTVDVPQDAHDLTDVSIPYLEGKMKVEEIAGAADCEEMSGPTSEVVVGDAVPLEHPSNCLHETGYEDQRDSGDVETESVQPEDATEPHAAADGVSNIVCSMSDVSSSQSENLVVLNESLSGSDGPNQKKVVSYGAKSPEFLTEVEPNLDSRINKSVSDEHYILEATAQVHGPSMVEQTENSTYPSDVIQVPSSELCNQEDSKPISQSHSEASGEDAMSSPTCSVPNSGNSLKQSMELQPDQISSESGHADLSTSHFPDQGILPDQLLNLQSNQLDRSYLQADEASCKSLDHIQLLDGHIEQERHLDTSLEHLPSQELMPQSASEEPNATNLASHLFNAVCPTICLPLDESPINLEEIPPMPPLPPMQWRMGKLQPAALSPQGECIDLVQNSIPQIKPFAADEKAQFDFASSGREIVQPPSPFLFPTVADGQSLQSLAAESVGRSLQQPTPLLLEVPKSVNDANDQQDCLPLEGKKTHNPFLTFIEVTIEQPEHQCHALEGQSMESNSILSSPLPTVECAACEHDPLPSEQPVIAPLNQLASGSGSETKASESQNSEGKQGNSPGESVVPITAVERQPQQDLLMFQGETFPPSTLALPPTYEVGKQIGAKLPRPRNPLIDAVAALDKSKLRKVTDRVRPQIGPKEDERDSLLQQIRTKSFNLKPAAATRHSIKGIQGPKTNLKVAAMLEKANAIRQALAGSDEDDDSDSWSDS